MPFGISKDEDNFWNQKELSYQHVHMFWSFWMGFIAYTLTDIIWVPLLIGALCGTLMEGYQNFKYLRTWEVPKKWQDMIRDFLFWTLGGCLNYIIIFVGK